MKKSKILLVMLCLLSLISCRNRNTEDNRQVLLETLNSMSEESGWLDETNEGWVLVKAAGHGDNKNWAVFYSHDWDEYYAVDMNAYREAMKNGIPIDTFLDAGYEASYYGEGNWSTATVQEVYESTDLGFFIGDYTGMIFEERNSSNKDLELIGSFLEKKNLQAKASKLENQFGLSEKRSLEVAKLIKNINKVKKNRGVTSRDLESFSKKLLGFNVDEALKAYEKLAQGEGQNWEALMEQAANKNDISPESMKEIISSQLLK
ncbi:hypothetical protein OAK75_02290 [Bacteriovoracales bacterium]|nr:hypothetical protein [Bacteriovoracales bacterium]